MYKFIKTKFKIIEKMVGEFKKGGVYAICTRPGIGKTHFCLSVASYFAAKGQKVFYMSDCISPDEFYNRQSKIDPDCTENIQFEQIFLCTIDRLNDFVSEQDNSLVIIDPIDIYSHKLDIDEIKDFAKKKNITILLSKHLSKPLFWNRLPALRDIKFVSKFTTEKFLAYVDVIFFAYRKEPHSPITLTLAKNIYGSIGQKVEIEEDYK